MTVTDQIKILDRKIMQNEAQYNLDRKAAKISALPSNNLHKYEHLTGEDVGPKPCTVEQAKFEYSPLGKIFNRGLNEIVQKEGLFKRLKKIENAQKNLINGIDSEHNEDKDQEKQQNKDIGLKPLDVFDYLKSLSQEVKDLMNEIEDAENDIDIYKLVLFGSNREKFSFNT